MLAVSEEREPIMTNEEILTKAIKKALPSIKSSVLLGTMIAYQDHDLEELQLRIQTNRYYQIIFSHDFAKAFFGEEKIKIECAGCVMKSPPCDCEYPIAWEYHLREMVIEEDPIKYLEKFL